MKTNDAVTERVPLLVIYRQNGSLHIEVNNSDFTQFEIYGFLSLYVESMRENLYECVYNSERE